MTMSCGPYPKLDGVNSMDLYSSRLTKNQDIFTFKSYYPRLAIHLIAQNISAASVVLETPSFGDFVSEIKKGYDYVGINFDTIFYDQVFKMVKAVKEFSPETRIILGGYGVVCLNEKFQEEQELVKMVDYVCHGEGIRFVRELLGEQVDAPVTQDFPLAYISIFGQKVYFDNLVSALGCRSGCEFCCTSAFYGYKKVRIVSASRLWELMKAKIQKKQDTAFTWIYDEDFFADPDYVREFAGFIKSDPDISPEQVRWGGYGSVRSLSQFTIEELLEMGVSSLWIGVESDYTDLPKRKGKDIKQLFSELHSAGIQTIGSFIIGWDFHSVENVQRDIDYFVSLSPTYSQVSSLMPCPETRLWKRMLDEGRLYTEGFKWRQHHLYSIMHRHKLLKDEDVPMLVQDTMVKLFENNGPSALRTFEANLRGYLYSYGHVNRRIKSRSVIFEKWCRFIAPALSAMKIYAPSVTVKRKLDSLMREYIDTFGRLTFVQHLQKHVFILLATILKISSFFPHQGKDPRTKRFYYNHK